MNHSPGSQGPCPGGKRGTLTAERGTADSGAGSSAPGDPRFALPFAGKAHGSHWFDPGFVRNWDRTTLRNDRVRFEQLELVTAIIAREYRPGQAILDLGCGTGLAEARIFAQCPRAEIDGLDVSAVMIDFARRRLRRHPGFRGIQLDLRQVHRAELPHQYYHLAFSILTLHEVGHPVKQRVFRFLFRRLVPGGIFLLNDKVAVPVKLLLPGYRELWDRLEQQKPIAQRLSFARYLRTRRFSDGSPASLTQSLAWLHAAGFEAACLHLYLNRAVIAARKKGAHNV
ncbi:MAG: class I SAM-dependent methyltransferase [candidate division WOR-3 bacterium]